jgi:hypothetical protein
LPARIAVALLLAGCASATPAPDRSAPASLVASEPSATASVPAATPSPSAAVRSPRPLSLELAVYALPELDGLLRGVHVSALSGGPAGIVLLGNDAASGALLSITSADGGGWVRHWLDGATFGGGTPDRLVAGPFGYLAVGWRPVPGSPDRALWSSTDGVAWSPAATLGLPAREPSLLVGTSFGAALTFDLGDGGVVVASSSDGVQWQAATLPGPAPATVYNLVPLPEGVLVLGPTAADQASGSAAVHAWTTTDGATWRGAAGIGSAISKLETTVDLWQVGPWGAVGAPSGGTPGVVTDDGYSLMTVPPSEMGALVAGSPGVIWFEGADPAGTCASGWQYTGTDWQPLTGSEPSAACGAAAQTYVVASATTATGVVVLGVQGDAGALTGWLIRPDGRPPLGGEAAGPAGPPVEAIPDALAVAVERPASCPAVPTTLEDLAKIEPPAAVGCFGDRDLTFRAWIVDPGEGYGGTCPAFSPGWIEECVLPDYLLAARRTSDQDLVAIHAMRSPGATGVTVGVGRWVRITGHYDDPVSPTCRGVGGDGSLGLESEIPPALAVWRCRLVFVVSDVRNSP